MKTLTDESSKSLNGLIGVMLITMLIGTGSAVAESYRWGDSTTSIEQHGGDQSETRVTRGGGEQRVITRNGSSSDITIQRDDSGSSPRITPDQWTIGNDRFEGPPVDERFSPSGACPFGNPCCSRWETSCIQRSFKQRMLDRMGERF